MACKVIHFLFTEKQNLVSLNPKDNKYQFVSDLLYGADSIYCKMVNVRRK